MYGELALKKLTKKPQVQDEWLPGRWCWAASWALGAPGQASRGGQSEDTRGRPCPPQVRAHHSLPSGPEERWGWSSEGHRSHWETSSAFPQQIKCIPSGGPSCSQGEGWAGPEVDLQKGTQRRARLGSQAEATPTTARSLPLRPLSLNVSIRARWLPG